MKKRLVLFSAIFFALGFMSVKADYLATEFQAVQVQYCEEEDCAKVKAALVRFPTSGYCDVISATVTALIWIDTHRRGSTLVQAKCVWVTGEDM